MVSAGRVLIMPKGAWNTTDTYSMLDLVSYNGSSYVAKQSVPANTLPTNTTYWQLSAYGGDASNLAGNFATLETTDYASQDYAVHDFLVTKDSVFCEVIDAISSGDEIIVDTNVEATDVGKLIQAVLTSMNSLDAENVKLKGKTAITTQTDLDDLTTIGNYYKSSTSVYVTHAPTGINEEITAVFRLTVENGSDATDTLIQTIVQDNGNTYKRSYDGTNWSSWDQVVLKSAFDTALSAKVNKTDIAPVEASSTATVAHDTGEQFYYDGVLREATADINIGDTITPGTNCKNADTLTAEIQTLTNNLADEVSARATLGAHNFADVSIANASVSNVDFTNEGNNKIKLNGTCSDSSVNIVYKMHLKVGTYIASIQVLSGSHNTEKTLWIEKKAGTTAINPDITITTETYKEKQFTVSTEGDYQIQIGIAKNDVFDNLVLGYMIRLASDPSTAYAPYAMTNRELTEYTSDVASNSYTKDGILVRVYRCGRQVMFLLGGTATADIAASTVLCTLDSKFVPYEVVNSIAIKGANTVVGKLNVSTNGQVYFDTAISNGEGPRLTSLCYIAKNP